MCPTGSPTEGGRVPILTDAVLHGLRPEGTLLSFEDCAPVVRRGEPGKAFYVVLSGAVEVRLVGEGGRQLALRRLGERAFFGEMSALTGDPVSADVVALGPTTVLAFPGDRLSAAMAESAPLREAVLASLVHNLRGVSDEAWNFFQRAEALHVLFDPRSRLGPLIVNTKAMRRVAEAVDRLAKDTGPVLILGASGTGKRFIASKIAESQGADTPFIVVDCRRLEGEEGSRFLFGSSRFPEDTESPGSPVVLSHYGALHLAHRGSLALLHVESLERPAQEALAQYLQRSTTGTLDYPKARVIATADADWLAQVETRRLHAPLAEILSRESVLMPSLRERKKDILPLARQFLSETRGSEALTISDGAEQVLVSRAYHHANGIELREAVELAALFASGGEILAEHIFTGPKEEDTPLEYDLGRFSFVRWLLRDSVLSAARTAIAMSFCMVVGLCLAASERPLGGLLNSLIWGAWEPAIIVTFLFLGRVWCTVCPLSTAGRLAARLAPTDRPPPAWLKRSSPWILPLGFAAILWFERAFHTTSQPTSAALLLLALLGGQVAVSLFFTRETWCRYLCPMGSLGAVYSLAAPLGVRANPHVCATRCTTHDCYNGDGSRPGCPVFHHPLFARDAHVCKLCFECLKTCRHGSAKLYLRPPLWRIWRQAEIGDGLLLFALVSFFLSPLLLAAQRTSFASTTVGFSVSTILALGAALACRMYLGRFSSFRDPAAGLRIAVALLVLSWGPAMAYQLGNSPVIAALELRSVTDRSTMWSLPVLNMLQGAVLLFAWGLAGTALIKIRQNSLREGSRPETFALVALCLGYQIVGFLLVGRGG